MSPTLLYPDEAAGALTSRLEKVLADWVCAEFNGAVVEPVVVSLRRGVRNSNLVEKADLENWYGWRSAWKMIDLSGLDGVLFESEVIRVVKVLELAPRWLRIESLVGGIAALERLGQGTKAHGFFLAAQLGKRLSSAGAVLTSTGVKAAGQLGQVDLEAAISTVVWLRDNPDLGQWTLRQLPVPEVNTKWVKSHLGLLAELTGRNLASETRPRLSIVHLTYLDPEYLASGRRRHDAWTSGDHHDLAYQPETVLVVENRDCRLWFPELENAVVVEGGGKEAPSLLKNVAWVRSAKHLVYWGDIDGDGFAILDAFRAEFSSQGIQVDSILMDERALEHYSALGVSHDRTGKLLGPTTRLLRNLSPTEAACYAVIGSVGEANFRRIEQERIDLGDALDALCSLIRK